MKNTNKNEMFKVMATLKAIVVDFAKKNKHIVDTIQFGSGDEKRFNFYLRAVKGAIDSSPDIIDYNIDNSNNDKKIVIYLK